MPLPSLPKPNLCPQYPNTDARCPPTPRSLVAFLSNPRPPSCYIDYWMTALRPFDAEQRYSHSSTLLLSVFIEIDARSGNASRAASNYTRSPQSRRLSFTAKFVPVQSSKPQNSTERVRIVRRRIRHRTHAKIFMNLSYFASDKQSAQSELQELRRYADQAHFTSTSPFSHLVRPSIENRNRARRALKFLAPAGHLGAADYVPFSRARYAGKTSAGGETSIGFSQTLVSLRTSLSKKKPGHDSLILPVYILSGASISIAETITQKNLVTFAVKSWYANRLNEIGAINYKALYSPSLYFLLSTYVPIADTYLKKSVMVSMAFVRHTQSKGAWVFIEATGSATGRLRVPARRSTSRRVLNLDRVAVQGSFLLNWLDEVSTSTADWRFFALFLLHDFQTKAQKSFQRLRINLAASLSLALVKIFVNNLRLITSIYLLVSIPNHKKFPATGGKPTSYTCRSKDRDPWYCTECKHDVTQEEKYHQRVFHQKTCDVAYPNEKPQKYHRTLGVFSCKRCDFSAQDPSRFGEHIRELCTALDPALVPKQSNPLSEPLEFVRQSEPDLQHPRSPIAGIGNRRRSFPSTRTANPPPRPNLADFPVIDPRNYLRIPEPTTITTHETIPLATVMGNSGLNSVKQVPESTGIHTTFGSVGGNSCHLFE
ncbi:hypothetical protein R3P38DRAFT_2816706 [Favolaschia claudopus]|uniref:Uncharacterized protein n=1 Tax=Favolaschia claudopus TaxID=2862362 RepID=A0AAV9YYP5_9AGAR